MHEKKTVMREESTQDDALLAIFFSCLFHETLTLFCILALKKNYTAKTTQIISKNYTGTQMDEVIMQIIARPFGLL